MTIPNIVDYPMPQPGKLPANRTSWQVQTERAVLLVHDMQEYFLRFYDPQGTLRKQLIDNIAKLLEWAKDHGVPVVYTAQPHNQSPEDRALLNDMWGPGLTTLNPDLQKVTPKLAPKSDDTVLTKWRYSAFQRSDLQQRMKDWKRDQLVVCGIYAHIGCMVTCVDAFMNDIQAFMVADAVADFSENEHQLALTYVATRCGSVTDTCALAGNEQNNSSADWLKSYVSSLLEDETEIDPEENLILYGLDSLQVMKISAQLKKQGLSVNFEELSRVPTLVAWQELIEAKRTASSHTGNT